MTLKVGGLFAGYGGLELGLSSVLDCQPAWFAEVDPAPARILAHHWPPVPNLGDVTKVDWTTVEPVDVITGGSPCQDLSHAGKRAGMKAGTRSGLWASMCDAVETIRPRLVVWENVRGALSAEADSAVEPCPLCVGDRPGPTLRALGRVLGDLAELRYDAWWCGLRAADVGAAHGRFRVFVFATPADAIGGGRVGWAPEQVRRPFGGVAAAGGGEVFGDLTLLPTPVVNDMGAAYTPQAWDEWTGRMRAEHGNGNGHGKSLAIEAQRLLSTPQGRDYKGVPADGFNQACLVRDVERATSQDWREYEAAIRRQEAAFGRPAPPPTEPGRNGQPRLSALFVEWLMALPEGHVTAVPGLSRNDMLKALGNGVVPPQAAAAARAFLSDTARGWVA